MLVYNVTTKVDYSIADAWLLWMQETHMPDLLKTGCFIKYQLLKILELDDADGLTYAAQYFASSKDDYDRYLLQHASTLRNEVFEQWGDKIISFKTIMQVID